MHNFLFQVKSYATRLVNIIGKLEKIIVSQITVVFVLSNRFLLI